MAFAEFLGDHWVLASLWLATLGGIIFYHGRSGGHALAPQKAVLLINRSGARVVDIRDKKDYDRGHIVQAINMPLARFKQRHVELKKHQGKPILVVCKMGQQSAEAVRMLKASGFDPVYKLNGGISEWQAQSLPLVQK